MGITWKAWVHGPPPIGLTYGLLCPIGTQEKRIGYFLVTFSSPRTFLAMMKMTKATMMK